MNKIFIYGTGNMAWALVHSFQMAGIKIHGIVGHTEKNTQEFSTHFSIPIVTDLNSQTQPGDIVFLAVKDDALISVNEKLKLPGRFIFHTAGSVNVNILKDISEHIGVFYPLQRVRKYQPSNFKNTPICIESNNKTALQLAEDIGNKISGNVIFMDSEKRQQAHIAAVFVSNFSNFMFILGHDLLKENNLPSNLLDPLLNDLISDLDLKSAEEKQTGPARRGDLKVIQSHLKLLSNYPTQESIYRLLSFEILKYFNR